MCEEENQGLSYVSSEEDDKYKMEKQISNYSNIKGLHELKGGKLLIVREEGKGLLATIIDDRIKPLYLFFRENEVYQRNINNKTK